MSSLRRNGMQKITMIHRDRKASSLPQGKLIAIKYIHASHRAGSAQETSQMAANVLRRVADSWGMNVSAQSPTSLLDSVLNADSARQDANVALLKKAQDIEKQQGQALVQMLEQSAPPADSHLDAYA